MNNIPKQCDSIQIIDLVRKVIKELVSEAIREELESLKSYLQHTPLVNKEYLTREQVAIQLHITLPTLRAWTKTGRIKSYKIARRVLYKPEDIDNALRKQQGFARK